MRRELIIGASLALAVALLILISGWLDLEVEAVALLGVLAGAIAAVAPSGSAASRLVGFLAGFGIAWVGFLLRAALLPDTSGGRAVAAALVVLACTGVALASVGRVRSWIVLLGAAAFTGAYEYTYDAAPPEVLTTSVSTATSLLLSAGLGWLAASWLAPEVPPATDPQRRSARRDDHETVTLTTMMDNKA